MARVLIVDDEFTVRYAMRSVLEHDGFDVLEAPDGIQALDRLKIDPTVELAIVDIVMPNKDGIEVIADFLRFHPDVKIIAISGGGGVGNFSPLQSLVDNHGVIGTLRKPFTDDQLLALVRIALAA